MILDHGALQKIVNSPAKQTRSFQSSLPARRAKKKMREKKAAPAALWRPLLFRRVLRPDDGRGGVHPHGRPGARGVLEAQRLRLRVTSIVFFSPFFRDVLKNPKKIQENYHRVVEENELKLLVGS